MRFEWKYTKPDGCTMKQFITNVGISKRLLSKIKYRGGHIALNGTEVTVREIITNGDLITISMPPEEHSDGLEISQKEIEILYEDSHYLIVNKPIGIYAVPSVNDRYHSLTNRVKGYLKKHKQHYQVVHVVNRLDRDTSGIMIFAKHSFAHSLLDKKFKEGVIIKKYTARVSGSVDQDHGIIDLPIARNADSIIKREVSPHGKKAKTEFWMREKMGNETIVDIQLHTGRTHQIRVHFAALGFPLVGDSLYGEASPIFPHHLLHCYELTIPHPFTNEDITIRASEPDCFYSL
ncbi:RluA family pseudouridine synthase [Lacticigenium naphthae]|uniref:RluA family pseudouridine synthase n=1 Tax=Lacticigenium naphthae TaxID=515351 RepID=UPI000414781D|nr:RluA family pseudouridine synthase [Lacticigenium naphthae]